MEMKARFSLSQKSLGFFRPL